MNSVSKHLLSFAFFLATTALLQAQDARYTQYYSAPQRVNPGLIGVFDGSWRAGLNYRSQWGAVMGQAYNSFSAHADMRVNLFSEDYLGLAFSALNDEAGLPSYRATDVSVGASYIKRLSSGRRKSYGRSKAYGSFLVAGAQVGFVQRAVNWQELNFSTQYQQGTNNYNSALFSGENMNVRDSKLSPDLSAGLTWYATFANRKSVYVGMGMFHLNRPDISLFNEPPVDTAGNRIGSAVERLYTRFTFHAGGEILLGRNRSSPISLLPGVVMMFQGPSTEINIGTSLRYKASTYDDFAFRVGLWTRIAKYLENDMKADALMVLFGLEYQNLLFGVSYDATISNLGPQLNSRGSIEFSLMYTHPSDGKRKSGCPTF